MGWEPLLDASAPLPREIRDATLVYKFVSAFEEAILHACKNKRNIAIHLSGGLDTRAILAVLQYHKISCSALNFENADDRELALQLFMAADNVAEFHGYENRAAMEDDYENGGYDLIISGSGMTELWEYFQYVSKRTKHEGCMYKIPRDMQRVWSSGANVFYPAFDDGVVGELRKLPNWWRRNKRLQLRVIREFAPELVESVAHDMPKRRLFIGALRKNGQRYRHCRTGDYVTNGYLIKHKIIKVRNE